jgi:hypothetical protein
MKSFQQKHISASCFRPVSCLQALTALPVENTIRLYLPQMVNKPTLNSWQKKEASFLLISFMQLYSNLNVRKLIVTTYSTNNKPTGGILHSSMWHLAQSHVASCTVPGGILHSPMWHLAQFQVASCTVPGGILDSYRWHLAHFQVASCTVPCGILHSPMWHLAQFHVASCTVPCGILHSSRWHLAVPCGILRSSTWHLAQSHVASCTVPCGILHNSMWHLPEIFGWSSQPREVLQQKRSPSGHTF